MKQVLGNLTIALTLTLAVGGCTKIKTQATESSQIKGAGDDQPTRLRVTNQCDQRIFVEHGIGAGQQVAEAQNRRLNPGESFDFPLSNQKVAALRLWPKIGCDDGGNNCDIGQSSGNCGPEGCQPPIDTKFEATFADATSCGDRKDAECVTWYNASYVDGYTIPYAVYPKGNREGIAKCEVTRCEIDVNSCPSDENIGGKNYDLKVVGKRSGRVVGCISPCKKLNYPAPWGVGMNEHQAPADYMCCPTPPVSSEGCRAGPVVNTKFVNHIRAVCPNVYTYAYDDDRALRTCGSSTKFEVVFCPKGGPGAGSGVGPGSPAPNPSPNPAPTPAPTPAPNGGGGGGQAIKSRLNGLCIDIPQGKNFDGARPQMWHCNGLFPQQFRWEGQTLRVQGKCLDVAGANSADGTPIQIATCNGNAAQNFTISGAGDLVSYMANKCVDIAAWNREPGAQLILWPCTGNPNQKWDMR